MSILTDIEAALEAKGKAARLLDSLSPFTTVAEDWDDAEADLTATEDDLNCLLTDDTIRALLAVVEALKGECSVCAAYGTTADECERCDTGTALTPLVVEDAMRPDAS